MTETNVRCDACGKPALEIHYNFRTENEGGYSDHVSDKVDLCHEHMQGALQRMLQESPFSPASSGKEAFKLWAKRQQWSPHK